MTTRDLTNLKSCQIFSNPVIQNKMKDEIMKPGFPQIWLLGATFETANLGINALAESSLKCLLTHWPNAEIILGTYGGQDTQVVSLLGREVDLKRMGLQLAGRNPFKANHIYRLMMYAWLLKLIPLPWVRKQLEKNPVFKRLMATTLVADITGGDSFSDIYGTRRFMLNALPKLLALWCNKPLILLPQTYGPLTGYWSQRIARYIWSRSSVIYSRDREGVEYVKQLLGKTATSKVIKFSPDVAFVLDPAQPDSPLVPALAPVKAQGQILIGVNVSGLIETSNSTTTGTFTFGLKYNYHQLMSDLITALLDLPNTVVVLIPHVYSPVESDPKAGQVVYEQVRKNFPARIFLIEEVFNHQQIKYLIGQCDFFVGARMHACIAAISQSVPAIGLAYSHKFRGVFESAKVGELVIELTSNDAATIIAGVKQAFLDRETTASKLRATIPAIQASVLGLFADLTTFEKLSNLKQLPI